MTTLRTARSPGYPSIALGLLSAVGWTALILAPGPYRQGPDDFNWTEFVFPAAIVMGCIGLVLGIIGTVRARPRWPSIVGLALNVAVGAFAAVMLFYAVSAVALM